MRDPAFWWRPAGLEAALLTPFAAVYGAVAAARMANSGRRVRVPVICIGNPTVGGAGKTPTAIAAARLLKVAGRTPFVLSRGYGGSISGPHRVDPAHDRSADVGDEPLLLARHAPTVISRDRVAGAEAAAAAGADVIVMDDGFQNPGLYKDISILVVDGSRGIGNGRVFPAGPLRAPLAAQLSRADAVLVIGQGPAGEAAADAARACGLPVLHGSLVPDAETLTTLQEKPLLAFAGIGNPEKFFATLRAAGLEVRSYLRYPDHHRYRRAEASELIARAEREGLMLVTTEKDLARLAGQDDVAALAGVARPLPVELVVEEKQAFGELLLGGER